MLKNKLLNDFIIGKSATVFNINNNFSTINYGKPILDNIISQNATSPIQINDNLNNLNNINDNAKTNPISNFTILNNNNSNIINNNTNNNHSNNSNNNTTNKISPNINNIFQNNNIGNNDNLNTNHFNPFNYFQTNNSNVNFPQNVKDLSNVRMQYQMLNNSLQNNNLYSNDYQWYMSMLNSNLIINNLLQNYYINQNEQFPSIPQLSQQPNPNIFFTPFYGSNNNNIFNSGNLKDNNFCNNFNNSGNINDSQITNMNKNSIKVYDDIVNDLNNQNKSVSASVNNIIDQYSANNIPFIEQMGEMNELNDSNYVNQCCYQTFLKDIKCEDPVEKVEESTCTMNNLIDNEIKLLNYDENLSIFKKKETVKTFGKNNKKSKETNIKGTLIF